MANRLFTQFFNTLHKGPVLLDCNFIVDSTNGNGLGIRSLKGPGIAAVYMHTSATPAPGNPNPQAGTIIVQLQDNYRRYFGGFSGQVGPVGSPSTSTTSGVPAIITVLGTATNAQWQAVGLPVSITPALGVSFIPTSSATIGGGASVSPAVFSGIDHIEVVGDPNTTINPSLPNAASLPPASGGYIVLNCLDAGVVTAPANGSVIGLSIYLSNSSAVG